MTETTTSPAAAAPAETPKKGKAKAAKKGSTPKVASKKGKAKADHPPTAQMVNEAIEALNEKKGSSLHAIKKYVSANYKLDVTKANKLILKYLRSAVISGKIVQSKGSFKFPGKDKPAAVKRSSPHKARKAPAKESTAPAKKTSPKKKAAPKKSPVKAKSPAKPKAKKLTAKPKKASPAKKPAAKAGKKKAAPKKK